MSTRLVSTLLSALAVTSVALSTLLNPAPQDATDEMAAMMAAAAKYTSPGEHHKHLERFVGSWNVETSFMFSGNKTPAEKATATFKWLHDGRWLQGSTKGTLMGNPAESTVILGYDNFKQSFVQSTVGTLDTAMLYSEGDMLRDGSAIVLWGTLDEYLNGEHDKMAKYIWRFIDEDTIVQEVHDLQIGETNTQVIEAVYKRR